MTSEADARERLLVADPACKLGADGLALLDTAGLLTDECRQGAAQFVGVLFLLLGDVA